MMRRTRRWCGSGLVAALLLPAPAWAQPPAPVIPGGADGAPVSVQMPDLPAPGEVLDDAELQRRLREVEAEIEMLGGTGAAGAGEDGALYPGWPNLAGLARVAADPQRRASAQPVGAGDHDDAAAHDAAAGA